MLIVFWFQTNMLISMDHHLQTKRIECWWSHLKKSFTTWVIDYFQDMIHEGIFSIGHHIHTECVWFVHAEFIQKQLNDVRHQWNTHYIRRSGPDTIPGIPDVLFFVPELSGCENKKIEIAEDDMENLLQERNIVLEAEPLLKERDEELTEYFNYVMIRRGLSYPPRNWQDARAMYEAIIELV